MQIHLSPKARLMFEIQQDLELNDFGMPIGLYRTDLMHAPSPSPSPSASSGRGVAVATDLADGSQLSLFDDNEPSQTSLPATATTEPSSSSSLLDAVSSEELRAAYFPLYYGEGYPALPDGRPIWMNLDFEPPEVHQIFERYKMMSQDGARQLFLLSGETDLEVDPQDLNEYYYLYYWGVRAQAYDLFRYAQARKVKEERALQLEDSQYFQGQRLVNLAMSFIESDDCQELMTPALALKFLQTGAQLQRINAGLPAQGPKENKKDAEPSGQSLEAIFRQYANGSQSNPSGGGTAGVRTIDQNGNEITDRALESEESTHLMQELILKMFKHD